MVEPIEAQQRQSPSVLRAGKTFFFLTTHYYSGAWQGRGFLLENSAIRMDSSGARKDLERGISGHRDVLVTEGGSS